MARGPEINNFVIRIIGEIADENPDFTAKEVTQAVQARLQRENLQAKPNWPGLSIVQNKMKEIRDEKFKQEPLGKDGPWSVGKLADFEIPFQAVPKLLTIQQLRSGYSPLTIREAKWIGRLQTVVDDVMDLAIWATLYAKREKICEQSNIEKDTSDIDPSLNAKVVTLPLYFQWLFKQDWIPGEHKNKVAIEQAQRYEEILGIKAKLPNFSTLGWLIYAGGLQELVLELPTRKNVSKGIRQFETFLLRLLANKEGKAQTMPSQYIDLLDGWKTRDFEEYLKSNVSPSQFTEELRKFNDPGLIWTHGEITGALFQKFMHQWYIEQEREDFKEERRQNDERVHSQEE